MKTPNAPKTVDSVCSSKTTVFPSAKSPKRFITRFRRSGAMFTISSAVAALLLSVLASTRVFHEGSLVRAFTESIGTFASVDCTTPKTSWDLGQTACAVVAGASAERRIVWIAPDGNVADVSSSFSVTGSDTYTFLTTGPFAQYGTWKVESMDNGGGGFAIVTFLVRPQNTASADISILKFGPNQAFAGNSISYLIRITNGGPDTAQTVVLSEPVPNDSTFVSEAQNSGPTAVCTNPSVGGTGTSTCTIPSLALNEVATFTFVYNVNAGTPVETLISNTATVSSSTNELFNGDNLAHYQTAVVGTPPPPSCTISCPADITTTNNGQNQCSVVVTYATPATSGSCADFETGQTPPVICGPPSGSAFPIGISVVTCASGGNLCSFTVTVQDTQPAVQPAIACPSDVVANEEFPGSGSATVTYPTPAATGNCVTVACEPASGSGFPVGVTTVMCTATDSSNNTATCSFTVKVNSGNCSITCPADITQAAPGTQCSAIVNYPDPTTSGTCGTVACTPPSGSSFPVGTTTVTCASSEGPTCSFTVTVTDSAPPTITTCASNKTISANANCEAVIPNLVSEVVANDNCSSVTISQSPTAGTIVGLGPTLVTITVEDSSGNESTCTATVTVVDLTPPTVSCPAGTTASTRASCQAAVPDVTGGVTASDNCTPAGLLTITQSPVAGTLVGAGTTTITVTVKDQANNSSTCMTTFTVNDTTAPTALCKNITVALDSNGNASIAAAQVDNGSSDNCGIASRTVAPSAFTCANKGANTVTLTVTDTSGNSSQCTAIVTVVDLTPPSITCPADIVMTLPLNSTATSMAVAYPAATAVDNCPGVTVVSTPASGSVFPVGTTTVTGTATDAAGNTASCSFTVTVLYNFAGFFPPVGNPPILNVVNAGRAIPVKFSLSGNKGLNIFASGFPMSGTIPCDESAPPSDVTETVTAGSSSLSYDPTSDQYIYVWKTNSSWAGTCRQLVVKLNDGSVHLANFKFR